MKTGIEEIAAVKVNPRTEPLKGGAIMAKRKELTEWLAGLGYRVCKCCMFDNYNTLHCCAVDRGVACYEVHGIPDYDEESGTGIELFKAENIKYGSPSYDCGV
jgi:hypothetical protein